MEALEATTDASLSDTMSSNSVIEIPGSAMAVKAKKKKKKEEEEEELKQPCKRRSCSTVLMDLGLSNKYSDIGSSSSTPPALELDLIGSLGSGSGGGGSTKTEGELQPASPKLEPRVFLCNYCDCKFYNFQSLGGHQNAHRHERLLAKRMQEGPSSLGLADSPMHRFLLHGAFGGQPRGIQVHSLLHKPYAGLAAGLPNGRHVWYQLPLVAPVIDPQPGVSRLFAENYGVAGATRGAVASFDHGGATATATVVGGYQWGCSGDQLSDGKEETKIDLTLKL